jgi:hypothetical protein
MHRIDLHCVSLHVKKSEAVRTPGGIGWQGEGVSWPPTNGWTLHPLCGGPPGGIKHGYE